VSVLWCRRRSCRHTGSVIISSARMGCLSRFPVSRGCVTEGRYEVAQGRFVLPKVRTSTSVDVVRNQGAVCCSGVVVSVNLHV